MENRLLQRLLANVVVQRGAGPTKEQRELLPMFQQVRNGPAQCRVRLHPPLVEVGRIGDRLTRRAHKFLERGFQFESRIEPP